MYLYLRIFVCLLKVTHLSLQSFTTLVRFINLNLPCFAISIYTSFLFQTISMSYEERRNWAVYIHVPPLTVYSYHGLQYHRSTTRSIALVHAQSFGHLITCSILSYTTHFHCTTFAYIHKIHRKIKCVCIAQRSL